MTVNIEKKTLFPSIPEIPDDIPEPLRLLLESLKETAEIYRGERPNADPLDSVITKRDLLKAGIVNILVEDQVLSFEDNDGSDESLTIAAKGEGQGMYGIPTAPTGLSVTGTAYNFTMQWDSPDYNGHWRTEVWRSIDNDIGNAVLIGTSRSLIFFDPLGTTATTRYYWIRHVNLSGKQGPYNAGTSGGTVGTTGQVVSDDIDTVAADKIIAATISAISANLGSITAGLMQSPDGVMTVDLNNKEIIIAGPSGQSADDYVIMTNGKLEFYKWTGSTHVLLKSVTNRQTGIANSGDTVTVPSYFDAQPDILLAPSVLQTYSQANSAQDQSIELKAENVTEFATGRWQFDAIARLILSSNSGNQVVNESSGQQSSNTYTSAVQTTPGNTTDFTVNVSVNSIRSTGTSPNYYNRDVDWRIGYKVNGSMDPYTYTSYKTITIGDTLSDVSDSMAVTGLTADTYDFIVEYIAADVTPQDTFTSGGTQYDFDEDTQSYTTPAASAQATEVTTGFPDPHNETDTASVDLGAYTPPGGWEVYNVDYDFDYAYELSLSGSNTMGVSYNGTYARALNHNNGVLQQIIVDNATGDSLSAGDIATFQSSSTSTASYVRNFSIKASIHVDRVGGIQVTVTADAQAKIKNVTATIQRRKPKSTSTTPDNRFDLDSYDYTLSGASVLATGTMKWVALGK